MWGLRTVFSSMWYPRIDHWHRFVSVEKGFNWAPRRNILNDGGIKALRERAGVPYLSSHKLGHGHAVYMMRRVKDMKQLKSLSQNLMHSSVAITDGIYGRLVSDDLAEMYESLGG